MHTARFPIGRSGESLERERRLCGFADGRFGEAIPGQKEIPFSDNAALNAAELFMQRLWNEANSKYGEIFKTQGQAEQNMMDESQWVEAFNQSDVFTVPARPESLREPPLDPRKYLESLSPAERQVEFVRYLRAVVPEDVREANRDVFSDAAFGSGVQDLDGHIADRGGAGAIGIDADSLQKMQNVSMLLIGGREIGETGHEREWDISAEVLRNRYSNIPLLIREYREAVAAASHPLTEAERRDPAALYRAVPLSRLRGALFLAASPNGRNIMPALAQSEDPEMGLALLSSRHDEAELRRQQTTDYVRKDFAEVDESVRRETERKALGFRENWDSMGGKEKFFSIAIASFIAYRMLKSDNAFIKGIPLALGGVYLYRRLVVGDEDPLNTMGGTLAKVIDLGKNFIRKPLEKMGMIASQEDRDVLGHVGRFLEAHGLSREAGAAFASLAEVELQYIADAFSFAEGPGGFTGRLPLTPVLEAKLSAIARQRGYSIDAMLREFRENDGDIGDAIMHVFFLLGTESNATALERLQASRDELSALHPGIEFKNMPDAEDRNTYRQLVEAGRESARGMSGASFLDILNRFTRNPEKVQRRKFDDAETLDGYPLDAGNRKNEKLLYDGLRNGLSAPGRLRKELAADAGLLHEEAVESVQNLVEFGILEPEAQEALLAQLDAIRKDDTLELREIFLAMEQLKYAVLVSAIRHDRKISLSDVQTWAGAMGRTTGKAILDGIRQILNRTPAANNFGRIGSLADIRSLLGEGLLTSDVPSLNGQGFTELRNQIAAFEQLFASLRGKETLNPTLVAFMAERLGDAGEARALMNRLLALQKESSAFGDDRIDFMERYLSQRMANAIAIAVLTRHQSSGLHTVLDAQGNLIPVSERMITPREERNLIQEFRQLFDALLGEMVPIDATSVRHDKEGALEMVDLLDTEITDESIDELMDYEMPALNHEKDTSYLVPVDGLTALARHWLLMNEIEHSRAPRLREKIIGILTKILDHYVWRHSKEHRLKDKEVHAKALITFAIQIAKLIEAKFIIEKLEAELAYLTREREGDEGSETGGETDGAVDGGETDGAVDGGESDGAGPGGETDPGAGAGETDPGAEVDERENGINAA